MLVRWMVDQKYLYEGRAISETKKTIASTIERKINRKHGTQSWNFFETEHVFEVDKSKVLDVKYQSRR